MPKWTVGDVTGSETLGDNDHLYPGHVNELREQFNKLFYDVKSLGAVGDGVTDDTSAIQGALDDLNSEGGGTLFFPEGTYKISDTLDLYSNILIKGVPRHSTIDFSSYDGSSGNFYALQAEGSLGSEILLTSNASERDSSLSLNTSGLSAKDYLLLYSDTRRVSTSPIYAGEFVRIEEITDGSNLSIYNDLCDDYTTADNAGVKKASFKENIAIEGIDFEGPTDAGIFTVGIYLLYCRNVKVRDCLFNSCNYKGIRAKWSIECSVLDSKFLDIIGTGLGYGVGLEAASQDWVINNNISNNTKNFVSIGSNNDDRGLTRRVHASGNVVTNSWGSAFDSHDNADDINYSNNTISGYRGFNLRCRNVNITGNIVDCYYMGMIYQPLTNLKVNSVISNNIFRGGTDGGIHVFQSTDDYGDIESLVINGNVVSENGDRSIWVVATGNLGPATNIVISNNTLTAPSGTGGIRITSVTGAVISGNSIETSGDSASAIYLSSANLGTVVANNYITSGSSTGTQGIRLAGATDTQIVGNMVTGAATGLSQDNSTTYSVVMGNNFRGCTTPLTLGTGTGHISETAAGDAYNIV